MDNDCDRSLAKRIAKGTADSELGCVVIAGILLFLGGLVGIVLYLVGYVTDSPPCAFARLPLELGGRATCEGRLAGGGFKPPTFFWPPMLPESRTKT